MGNWNAVRFGEELRRWRTARGMSQADVAAAVGSARNSVSRWEVGEFLPAPVQMHRLQELMGAEFPVLLPAAQVDVLPESLQDVLAEARAALDTAFRDALNTWYRTYPARILAAAQGQAPPAPEGPLDDSDAIEATAMRALLEADQAAAAATPAPPAAPPRAASGTRSRRPR